MYSAVERLWWSDFVKIVSGFWPLTMFVEEHHPGFFTRF